MATAVVAFRGHLDGDAADARVLPVATTTIQMSDGYEVLRYCTGQIEPRRQTALGFNRGGRVATVEVTDGQPVTAGTILARLDTAELNVRRCQVAAQREAESARLAELNAGPRPEQLDEARAHVARFKAQFERAKVRAARLRDIFAKNLSNSDEVKEAAFDEQAADAQMAAAGHRLQLLLAGTRAEQIQSQRATVDALDAQLAAIDVQLADSVLRAPFTGSIERILADEATIVGPSQPLMQLLELGVLEAWIGVPVDAAGAIRVGDVHRLVIGDQEARATITSILPQLDRTTRTVQVVLRLDTNSSGTVMPGQIAQLALRRPVREPGYWVPLGALAASHHGLWSLYALDDPLEPGRSGEPIHRVRRADVQVLHSETDRVFVRGSLPPRTLIVAAGVHRVVAGQKVQPVPMAERELALRD